MKDERYVVRLTPGVDIIVYNEERISRISSVGAQKRLCSSPRVAFATYLKEHYWKEHV